MTTKAPEPAKDAGPGTGSLPAQPSTGATPAVAAPAPTPVAPKKTAPKPVKRGTEGPLVILCVLAVLVALGATGIAVYALDQAREATSRANEARDIAGRAVAPVPARPTTPPARPSASATPSPSRGPVFTPEVARQPLRVPPGDSPCASVYVNVDNMSFGTATGHDFYLTNCVGPLSVHVDRTSGAVPTANNPTPEVCSAQITAQTSTAELVLPVVNGLTFCLLTNKADAVAQNNPQRIAIVEVTDIAADNTVTLAVSTYRVPTTS